MVDSVNDHLQVNLNALSLNLYLVLYELVRLRMKQSAVIIFLLIGLIYS